MASIAQLSHRGGERELELDGRMTLGVAETSSMKPEGKRKRAFAV
jgi:hypothetical protein